MKDSTRKQLATAEGETAALNGKPITDCPYRDDDRLGRGFNWRMGYTRALKEARWLKTADGLKALEATRKAAERAIDEAVAQMKAGSN